MTNIKIIKLMLLGFLTLITGLCLEGYADASRDVEGVRKTTTVRVLVRHADILKEISSANRRSVTKELERILERALLEELKEKALLEELNKN